MILRCFEVCRVVCFRLFSLDFVVFEVFHPVWALYNIIREAGHMSEPPPQASCAGQVFALSQRCTGCPCARRARKWRQLHENAPLAVTTTKVHIRPKGVDLCPAPKVVDFLHRRHQKLGPFGGLSKSCFLGFSSRVSPGGAHIGSRAC